MGTPPQHTSFEADPQLGDMARLMGYAVGAGGALTLLLVAILGLTGAIPFDPVKDWGWTLFIALSGLTMIFVVPRTFTQKADLKLRQPLLEISADALSYAGSRIPDTAIAGVMRADLNHRATENTTWIMGDVYYLAVRRDQLGFTRKDSVIDTRRSLVAIETSDFVEPARMHRALLAHLEAAGIPFAECDGTTELHAAEKRFRAG